MHRVLQALFVHTPRENALWLETNLAAESGLTLTLAETETELTHALKTQPFSVAFSTFPNPSFPEGTPLAAIQRLSPQTPLILVADEIEAETAIELLAQGAADIVLRRSPGRLASAVQRVLGRAAEAHNRAENEALLRESEDRFRQLCEATFEGLVIHEGGKILNCNRSLCRMFGYELEEVLGSHVLRFIHRSHHDLIRDRVQRSVKKAYEVTGVRKDGSILPIEVQGKSLPNRESSLRVVAVRDLTDRKRSEQALREQARLLEVTHDAIAVATLKGELRYFNPAAGRLFEWSQTAVGQQVAALVSDYDRKLMQEAAGKTVDTGAWKGELNLTTLTGKKLVLDSRWSLMTSAETGPESLLIVNTDITEKKRLEAQFLRTQRLESIGTLAGGIAHDLNNILSPSLMAVHLLRENIVDSANRIFIETLESSLQRGAGIVAQVLTFARGLDGERGLIQPGHLLNEMIRIARAMFPKSISVDRKYPADLWLVSADATQFHQVLLNLCVNARDAMPNGGQLELSADNVELDENYARMNPDAHPGPYVQLKVRDTGTGIPPDVIDKIFEPFFTTKDPGKGTGLGLSTALGIVKSHQGFIHVYSELGHGTEFSVYLPASPAAQAEAAGPAAELPLGRAELILVADDEAPIREITKSTLEAYGYAVLTACDGAEAVAVCARESLHLQAVLMDIMMPVLDGAAAIRVMEKLKPNLKVIATSGIMTHERQAQNDSPSVRSFLQKPFTAEKLLRTLRRVLDENPSAPQVRA